MEIVYRPMHLSDVDKVWELLEVLKEENSEVSLVEIPDKDELKEWLDNDGLFLYIAENEEAVLGLLKAKRDTDVRKRHAVFLSIGIHPEYRGRGIAKELTNTGLEDMKKDGVTIARAYVYSNNAASVNTILRLGFTFSGCVHKHHFNPELGQYVDDLIFHKIL